MSRLKYYSKMISGVKRGVQLGAMLQSGTQVIGRADADHELGTEEVTTSMGLILTMAVVSSAHHLCI